MECLTLYVGPGEIHRRCPLILQSLIDVDHCLVHIDI